MKHILALSLSLAWMTPTSWAAGGDYVQWVLESPSDSPFAELRYEITERGPASAAIHRRRLPGGIRSFHNMGLVPPEVLDQLRTKLTQNAAMTLPDATQASHARASLRWRFDVQLDGKKHSFVVTDPINQQDRRYWRLFSAVKQLVRSITGGLPFRDIYHPKEKLGWLTIDSVPAGRLTVNGRDTELETPVRDLPLLKGKHTIELKSVEGNTVRSYDIRIEAGGYTKLKVELR